MRGSSTKNASWRPEKSRGAEILRRIRRVFGLYLLWTIVGPSPATHADRLVFRKGGEIRLPAEVSDTKVRVQAPGRVLEFDRDDFEEIQEEPTPEERWRERLHKARKTKPPQLYEAAWWGLEHGFVKDAKELIREAAEVQPGCEPVARLRAMDERLEMVLGDPSLEPIRERLPRPIREARSDHILLLHQQADDEAVKLLANLENVFQAYYLVFTGLGFTLELPKDRAVVCWMSNRREYQDLVAREGGEALRNTGGYYSPARRMVFVSDSRGFPSHRDAVRVNERRRAQWKAIQEQIERLPANGRFQLEVPGEPRRVASRAQALERVDEFRREVDRQDLLLDMAWRSVDLGTAAHELIHWLAYESGLKPRGVEFPLWMHEGLAMQFEATEGARWAGVGQVHPRRLADYHASEVPTLDSLLRDEGLGHGYRSDRYAAAWGWILFLRSQKPAEFVQVLDLLRSPGAGPASSRWRQAIEAVFGDQERRIEAEWHAFMAKLKD